MRHRAVEVAAGAPRSNRGRHTGGLTLPVAAMRQSDTALARLSLVVRGHRGLALLWPFAQGQTVA